MSFPLLTASNTVTFVPSFKQPAFTPELYACAFAFSVSSSNFFILLSIPIPCLTRKITFVLYVLPIIYLLTFCSKFSELYINP